MINNSLDLLAMHRLEVIGFTTELNALLSNFILFDYLV